MAKVILRVTILVVLCFLSVTSVHASIQPIIVSEMPNPINSGLQNVNLKWVVIDDNPKSYEIYINDKIWKKNSIITDIITVQFSDVEGFYNLTLFVYDYSGNSVSASQLINISTAFPITEGSNPSKSPYSAATPGFGFSVVFAVLTTAVIYNFSKRKRKKN